MLSSLRHQLMGLWALMALACVVLALLLYGITRHSEKVQVAQATGQLAQACEQIQRRYLQAAGGLATDQRTALAGAVLQLVLEDYSGVEGGIWQTGRGVTAYAYPTYQGSGSKTDVPPAELPNIARTAQQAVRTGQPAEYRRAADREVLLLRACPMPASQGAWVMTRVHTESEAFYQRLRAGLAALFGVVLFSLGAVAWVLARWDRKLGRIERQLAEADPSVAVPLSPSGSDELDRLGQAINRYASRSVEARREAGELAAALARGARLAGIGRMVATVAHEIRNPIAAMRLTAENALASAAPDPQAMQRMLRQVQRLDGMVERLLGMAQPIKLNLLEVELAPWLEKVVAAGTADTAPVQWQLDPALPARWRLDPAYLEQALDNLLRNARQHSAEGAPITLRAVSHAGQLQIAVGNRGEPIPAAVAQQLFEPFVSGRADGHGLGLALVREIALSHGGQARYEYNDGVIWFFLELPWPSF